MKTARKKTNSITLSKSIADDSIASRNDASIVKAPAASTTAKKEEQPSKTELEIEAAASKAFANSAASDMDIAVGTTAIQDMLAFLTGDAKIADFKLRYIAETAGYHGIDLKGKRWSFANNGADYKFFIYPETLEEAFQAMGDFSMKKTYGTLNTILSKMPKVEIRSYQQRTLLQSIADGAGTFISDVAGAIKSLWNGEPLKTTKEEAKTVIENIKHLWEADPGDNTSLFGRMIQSITPEEFKGGPHAALLNLPFIFYYCLASSTTRCYFSLPLDSRSYENLWGSPMTLSITVWNTNM